MTEPAPLRVTDRLLRASGARLMKLPRRVMERLGGGVTVNSRGHSLDPQVKLILELDRLLGFPHLNTLGVDAARKETIRTSRLVDAPSPPVFRVMDRTLPTTPHPVPVRVYQPRAAAAALPGILYIHGGGFTLCDLNTHDSFARTLAVGADCVVVSVDYRLGPEWRFPAAADDVVTVYRHVLEHAADFGINPAKLAVGGESAGGNLSAVITQEARRLGLPQPVLQLLIYPALDMVNRTPSRDEFANGYFLTDDLIDWFLDQYLKSPADRKDLRASPGLATDLRGLAPAHVITAGFDPLVDEGANYAKRLAEAGVPTLYTCETGLIHGFVLMTGLVDSARLAVDRMARNLKNAFAAVA